MEGIGLCVGTNEARGWGFAFGTLAGGLQHGRRDVDTEAAAVGTKLARNGERRAAGAAADIEHVLRPLGAHRFNKPVFKRLEHLVERRLAGNPSVSGVAVPEGGLVAVD